MGSEDQEYCRMSQEFNVRLWLNGRSPAARVGNLLLKKDYCCKGPVDETDL